MSLPTYSSETLPNYEEEIIGELTNESQFGLLKDRQLAFELASQYKQLILDREFATRLQGLSSERVNIDTQNYKNLLGVINQAEQQRLTRDLQELPSKSSESQATAKGKGASEKTEQAENGAEVICKICETGFILVSSPITNPQIPTSSKSILQELGISIPICRHSICQPCLLSYIDLNLKEARSQRKRIFPLICPGCDDEDSTKTKGSIDDETLKKVMDCENQNWEKWMDQKEMDSFRKFWCRNLSCSKAILKTSNKDNEVRCTSCSAHFCNGCLLNWHANQTCTEAFRDKDDSATLALAKVKGWQRCGSCRHMVERNGGCPHVRCKCSYGELGSKMREVESKMKRALPKV